ncbi:unnamed protein product [Caenorhabditis brenneri]
MPLLVVLLVTLLDSIWTRVGLILRPATAHWGFSPSATLRAVGKEPGTSRCLRTMPGLADLVPAGPKSQSRSTSSAKMGFASSPPRKDLSILRGTKGRCSQSR